MRLLTMLAACAAAALPAAATAMSHGDGAAKGAASTGKLIETAIAGPQRSEANRARDRYRNPQQTLLFFGLTPDKSVVEVLPGAGWYTEILAPVLRDSGRLTVSLNDAPTSEGGQKQLAAFKAKLAAPPFDKVEIASFPQWVQGKLQKPASADMILTFRNVHNWVGANVAPQTFKAFYDTLKPGGVLGVVEHRLPENRPDDEKTRASGYMKESEVIRLAEAAGFRLDARSEINANPRDTADHPAGVWTLPPNYRLGDKDRAKYEAIGESDRMTLRFVKPAGTAAVVK
jgi:predicted methyltransferase